MTLACPWYSISQIRLNTGVISRAPMSLSDCILFAFASAFVVCGLRRINLSFVLVGGC